MLEGTDGEISDELHILGGNNMLTKEANNLTIEDLREIPDIIIPRKVGIIMDGNGRWATRRGLPRIEGHREGGNALHRTVLAAAELANKGVIGQRLEALALYAFSTENWNRPEGEVQFLMEYNRALLEQWLDEFHSKGVVVKHLGRRDCREYVETYSLPSAIVTNFEDLLQVFDNAYDLTKDNEGLKLNICFNYGGWPEVVDTFKQIAHSVAEGDLKPQDINEETIHANLYSPNDYKYDLIIRTADEIRLSGFLLWESVYAEFFFTPTFWPDFYEQNLCEAIYEFSHRKRKFGAVERG